MAAAWLVVFSALSALPAVRVLCFGEDGHVAIEPASHAARTVRSETPLPPGKLSSIHDTIERHSNPCLDFALAAGAPTRASTVPTISKSPKPDLAMAAPALVPRLPRTVADMARPAGRGDVVDPALLMLATVILLT